jgi:membrane-associated HD superfamily phosphohydrolase
MPMTIVKLIDILSIKKEYLVNSEKMTKLFSELLYEQISSDYDNITNINTIINNITNIRLSSIISSDNEEYPISSQYDIDALSANYKNNISDEKLSKFIEAVFINVLSSFCNLTYNNQSYNKIYVELSDNYLYDNFNIENTNEDELIQL